MLDFIFTEPLHPGKDLSGLKKYKPKKKRHFFRKQFNHVLAINKKRGYKSNRKAQDDQDGKAKFDFPYNMRKAMLIAGWLVFILFILMNLELCGRI